MFMRRAGFLCFLLFCYSILLPASGVLGEPLATHKIVDIYDKPEKGMDVALKGVIVKEINFETILFDDGTGQIEVVLDEDDFIEAKAFEKGQLVMIYGSLDSGFHKKINVAFEEVEILEVTGSLTPSVSENEISRKPVSQTEEKVKSDKKSWFSGLWGSKTEAVATGTTKENRTTAQSKSDGQSAASQKESTKVAVESAGNEEKAYTIAEILDNPPLGEEIELTGYIIEEKNYETVVFDDDTGQIDIYLDDDDQLSSDILKDGVKIKLYGEVRRHRYHKNIYIEYESARILSVKQEQSGQPVNREGNDKYEITENTIQELILSPVPGSAVKVSGEIQLFFSENEFVLVNGPASIVVDFSSIKEAADLQEGQSVTIRGVIAMESFSSNRKPRPTIKAEAIKDFL